MIIYRAICLILSSLLHLDATLLTGPEAVVSNDVSPNDVLTISWPAPMNANFLVAYRVSYTTSPVRGRRQTPSTREVPAGMTRTTLPFAPFTNFIVDVDAVYAPPPDGNRVVIRLLPSTMFTTTQKGKKCTAQRFKLFVWGGGGGRR